MPTLVAEVRELRAWRDTVALGLGYAEQHGAAVQIAPAQHIVDRVREEILGGPDDTRLLGSTNIGEHGAWPSTAGEFAARWNAHTPEEREERARAITTALQRQAAREERP